MHKMTKIIKEILKPNQNVIYIKNNAIKIKMNIILFTNNLIK